MPVNIIVEDGTLVADANSYIDVAYARQYAEMRGVLLPSDDDVLGAMLILATDFLESFACEYAGRKVSPSQSLQWPRQEAYLFGDCEAWPSDTIPKNLKQAQAAAVIAVSQGLSLLPNIGPQDFVIEETVGPITTKYSDPVKSGVEMKFTGVDSLLASLFGKCGHSSGLRTIRV